jgi:hypothetical protein
MDQLNSTCKAPPLARIVNHRGFHVLPRELPARDGGDERGGRRRRAVNSGAEALQELLVRHAVHVGLQQYRLEVAVQVEFEKAKFETAFSLHRLNG